MELSKSKIKEIASLKQGKYRKLSQSFLVEGVKHIEELLETNHKARKIIGLSPYIEAQRERLSTISQNIYTVSETVLRRLSTQTTPNQVIAVLDYLPSHRPNLGQGLTLALDRISDPGNLGTIIRIADWFGIENIVCSPDTVDLYNPKTIQATMGSYLRVNLYYTDLAQLFQDLNTNIPIYGTVLEGGENLHQSTLATDAIIVLGSESHGISPEVLNHITNPITIPSHSKGRGAESLNVSIATAIICSEFRR